MTSATASSAIVSDDARNDIVPGEFRAMCREELANLVESREFLIEVVRKRYDVDRAWAEKWVDDWSDALRKQAA